MAQGPQWSQDTVQCLRPAVGQEGEEKEHLRPNRRRKWWWRRWWPWPGRECVATRPWPVMTGPSRRLVAGSVITFCFNKSSHVLLATALPDWPGCCADMQIIVVPYRRSWEPATSMAKLTTTDRSSRKAFLFLGVRITPRFVGGTRNHELRVPPPVGRDDAYGFCGHIGQVMCVAAAAAAPRDGGVL